MKGKQQKQSKVQTKPLFEVTTIIDEKEFNRYQSFYLNKFKASIIPKIIFVLLFSGAFIFSYLNKNTRVMILLIAFIIIYPILFYYTIKLQIKKMYKSDIKINMLEETISFYKDYLESKSNHNYCKIEYKDLYKICETKKNFYIFVKENQAFIVLKSNVKELDQFTDFIKKIGPYKRYR